MSKDQFDLDALRIDPTDPVFARAAAPKQKWKRQFIIFSWEWFARLKTVRTASACRLALFLAYEHWRAGGRPIKLTNAAMADIGVSPDAKGRALDELERVGLIKADRFTRRSPIVIVLVDPRAGP
jgi:hypothetical protein